MLKFLVTKKVFEDNSNLPYDAEIEYLESTGTQYIDTLFKANTTTTQFKCKIIPLNISTTQGIFGSRNTVNSATTDACNIFIISNTFRLDWVCGTSINASFNISNNTEYEISIIRGKAIINGTTITNSNTSSINQNYNFLIGNFTNGSNTTYSTGFIGKIKYAQLYNNNSLIHDFIPVRKGNIGYMYDKVSGQLFGNSGTGSFILGPDTKIIEPEIPNEN
jgi:hypothetical protein